MTSNEADQPVTLTYPTGSGSGQARGYTDGSGTFSVGYPAARAAPGSAETVTATFSGQSYVSCSASYSVT